MEIDNMEVMDMGKTSKYVEPYQHNCTKCVWFGWLPEFPQAKHGLANVYYHRERNLNASTIIIRYGNAEADYVSLTEASEKSPTMVGK